MLTAYDYTSARLADQAGVDVLLVGDSLGMVVLGAANTLAVTVDDIVHHTRAVVRARPACLVVADMPFLSFQISADDAVRNAGRMLKEGGAGAVKLEGGASVAPLVTRLTQAGIPVMGHLGMTPQSVHGMGGFRLQARTGAAAQILLEDALALEAAGAFALVLELIPSEVAAAVSRALRIPTLGIGAGPHCDGEVQVWHDLLGLFEDFTPRHTRHYAELGEATRAALTSYAADVRSGAFPGEAQSFHAPELEDCERWKP